MDRNGIVVGVEDDDLEQPPSTIGTDHQDPIFSLTHDAERHLHRRLNVFIGDPVSSSPVSDLHT